MAATGSGLRIIERILRDREGVWRQIADERDLNRLIGDMLVSSAVALAFYGAVLGSFSSPLMTVTSAVKLPLLFLATLAICLPALYLFNLVFGARLSVRQALALVMVAITVISMLSLAFAPISLFFRITSPDYEFFKILNVAILTLTAVVGLRFLTSGMRALNELTNAALAGTGIDAIELAPELRELAPVGSSVGAPAGTPAASDGQVQAVTVPVQSGAAATQPAPVPATQPAPLGQPVTRPALASVAAGEKSGSMTLLYVWIMLFGFVGTQLAWTLRPFFGAPTEEFALFRNLDGNFYTSILNDLARLF